MRYWVFCYDMADDRRRRRVARVLADAGAQRVQESVFEGWFSSREIAALRTRVGAELDAGSDAFRCYVLPAPIPQRRQSMGIAPSAASQGSAWVI